MNEQETAADIIAEMRFHGQQNIDAEKDKPEYGILTVEGRIAQNYADRLEAAHKRETEAVGDAKKLGAALLEIRDAMRVYMSVGGISARRTIEMAFEIARAALAAPPRNCDVGTAEEQIDRMLAFCGRKGKCTRCKNHKIGTMFRECTLRWAQMPYEEGDAK